MSAALNATISAIEACGRDARTALRRLAKAPGFVVLAVLSLGLGIGIPTAVYSVIHEVLWAPFGVRDPQDFVVVEAVVTPADRAWEHAVSDADFAVLREQLTNVRILAASSKTVHTIEVAAGQVLNVQAEHITGPYFAAIGLEPAVGRLIDSNDDSDSTRAAVLSEAFWRARLAADPDVLGATLSLDGQTYEVVGVAPKGFGGVSGAGLSTDVWIPAPPGERSRVTVIGRLQPGASQAAATSELAQIATTLDQTAPLIATGATRPVGRGWRARSAAEITRGPESVSRYGVAVVGVVALVILVACTNLASLFLARSVTDRRELILRRALGASWLSLMREHVFAGLLLAAAGCLTSLLVARGLLGMWAGEIQLTSGSVTSLTTGIGNAAVLFAVSAAGFGLIVFATLPAIQVIRQLAPVSAFGDRFTHPNMHGGLIRFQAAISVCLFLVATAGIKHVATAARHDSGVSLDRLAVISVDFGAGTAARGDLEAIIRTVADQPEAGPVSVSWSTGLPFGINAPAAGLTAIGVDLRRPSTVTQVMVAGTPGIFNTLGIPVVAGRGFAASGDEDAIVVSLSSARELFGSAPPLGRQVLVTSPVARQGSPTVVRTIVGVVADTDVVRFGSRNGAVAYVPLTPPFQRELTAVVHATDPIQAARLLHLAVHRLNPTAKIEAVGTGSVLMTGPFRLVRFASLLVSALGVVALILSMIGLYGVLSLSAANRTREIGIRSALGASPGRLTWMFVREGLTPVLTGLLVGVGIGTLVRVALSALMGGVVAIVEPVSLVVVTILMTLAGTAACYVPSRRAARVNPAVVLQDL